MASSPLVELLLVVALLHVGLVVLEQRLPDVAVLGAQ